MINSYQNKQLHIKIQLEKQLLTVLCMKPPTVFWTTVAPGQAPLPSALMWTPRQCERAFNDPTGLINWVENVQVWRAQLRLLQETKTGAPYSVLERPAVDQHYGQRGAENKHTVQTLTSFHTLLNLF